MPCYRPIEKAFFDAQSQIIGAANQRVRGMIGRALLVIAIVGTTLHHAGAQLGAPPAQCQELLTLRDELQKHGEAIEAANQKKADMTGLPAIPHLRRDRSEVA